MTDKVETWLSAGGSRQLIERNEEIYSEMLEQRKGLLKDFEKVRDQGKDDLYVAPVSLTLRVLALAHTRGPSLSFPVVLPLKNPFWPCRPFNQPYYTRL